MQDIYDYIDQHAGEFVSRLQTLCRQPSIAAQNKGMAETAAMVLELLRQVQASPQLVPTGGFPGVFQG